MAGGLTLRDQHQRAPSAGPAGPGKEDEKASRPGQAVPGQHWSVGMAAKLGKDPGAPLAGRRQGWCSAVQRGAAWPQAAHTEQGWR